MACVLSLCLKYFSQALGNPNESFSKMIGKSTAVPFNHKQLQWPTRFSLELGLVLDIKELVLGCYGTSG
jgi:hypothetical protein